MRCPQRAAQVKNAAQNRGEQEMDFALALESGGPLQFVAKIGAVEQVIAGLSRMATDLRQRKPQLISAGEVSGYLVRRDVFGGPILLRLISPMGVPYTFALRTAAARDISDRLKIESEKHQTSGSA